MQWRFDRLAGYRRSRRFVQWPRTEQALYCREILAVDGSLAMDALDFRRIALSLEGAEEVSHAGLPAFRVGGRRFASLVSVADGYGNLALTPELQSAFVKEAPEIFVPIAGGFGRMGHTHIRLAAADEDVLTGALRTAWKLRVEGNARTRENQKKRVSTARGRVAKKASRKQAAWLVALSIRDSDGTWPHVVYLDSQFHCRRVCHGIAALSQVRAECGLSLTCAERAIVRDRWRPLAMVGTYEIEYRRQQEGKHMADRMTRRDAVRRGLSVASLLALAPEWVTPALAQGETLVPFTDLPPNFNPTPTADRRTLDVQKIEGPLTPADQFFTTQHYGHPVVDPATFALKISGLVERPKSFSLDELRKMRSTEMVVGFECSGNGRPREGLASNGRWTGVGLKAVLDLAGVKPQGRELVFFGSDHAEEDVDFRGQITKVDQQFGRSLSREKALSVEPLLAYALNGEPLTRHQGFPLRLIVPGWYGVANVKWLSAIHAQEDPYLGKFQARWYRTLKGEMIAGETKWTETAITHMQLKSFIARVTRDGGRHRVLGVVLNDGTPLKSVEVRVDEGPWMPAKMDPATSGKYSWKLFTYDWFGATPGEHTLVSRVTDVNGKVQPTREELATKKTFLEDNAQFPRKLTVS